MQCPRCQQDNPLRAKFCLACGAPVTESASVAKPYTDLKHENERLNRSLTDALEQQTATSEILRVISRSPTDAQPVFDAILRSAVTLCNSLLGNVVRVDGDLVRLVATLHPRPEEVAAIYPAPLTASLPPCRAIRENTVIHVPDVEAAGAIPPAGLQVTRAAGIRSLLVVPMRRDEQPIGAILIARPAVGPFPDEQIALLQTFADQAVIAIENVRLFTELQEKNQALTQAHAQVIESLEQQTATAEILRVISSSPTDIQPVLEAVTENASRLCRAANVSLYRVEGDLMRKVAEHEEGLQLTSLRVGETRPITRTSVSGRAIIDRAVIHVRENQSPEAALEFPDGARRDTGIRTTIGFPLLREGSAIGAFTVYRTEHRPFTEAEIALLQTFADQAVIAIENVRLFNETKEALEQQTATAEILRVISSSPTDVQPVFDTIAESAVRLCDGLFSAVFTFDGTLIKFVAHNLNWTPEGQEAFRRGYPRIPSRDTQVAQAILERAVIEVRDLMNDPGVSPWSLDLARSLGYRSNLVVPMLRDGSPIGAIGVARVEAGSFSAKQIELLKTFADQAVIAVENVRLFKELQEKNGALTEALEQQTATSEILQTIAQAQTDVQPVFDTIVRSAAQLCRANTTAVFLTDGHVLYHPANYGSSREVRAAIRANFPRPLDKETVSGAAILTRSVVQVPDIEEPSVTKFVRQVGRGAGFRSMLSVPMLRQGEAVGAINVTRPEPGSFSDAEVALLQTFADQAVIAIENVRLFTELEAANRELAAASQHKSEFLANMSHELRTPLNAIIGFSEVLSERMFGELNEKQAEYLKDIYASGTHLLSLINDILDLSKIEAGRMELELTDFDLPTALDNALMLVRERAQRRSLTLHKALDVGVGQVKADERKIRQVVLNLLSNAIKFTPEGGRIEIAAVPRDGLVEVSVSDTGVGIAPEDQNAIFEEFRQVGTAEKKAEGTGLGLTLCRKFIELHGGRIWAKSQLGAGSTFTFTIPVRHGE